MSNLTHSRLKVIIHEAVRKTIDLNEPLRSPDALVNAVAHAVWQAEYELLKAATEPGTIQELHVSGPTREDRAYQVLCALLASPQDTSQEAFADSAWAFVDLMKERGAK